MSTDTRPGSLPHLDPPREPGHYRPTRHAQQQKRHRDIPWTRVADAVSHGEVQDAQGKDCVRFIERNPPEDSEHPVATVANVDEGILITVMWRGE